MAEFSDIKKETAHFEALEKELNLKQLQVKRLLNITQAINNNVSAAGLFEMYRSFLSWEMGVKKMALFFLQEKNWVCTAHIGISEELLKEDVSAEFSQFDRLRSLDGMQHPLLSQFDVVIPVKHKEMPLAYVFIGGFDEEEDMYNKVQFITTITNIVAVAIENKRLFKRQIEQERMRREMELARQMQLMLIPSHLPKSKHYELASIYQPHLVVGGDYFDFVELEKHRIAFCIGDISGKGVAAALLMANFQANFQSLIHIYQDKSLADFVQALNQSIFRITKGEKFITFFVAEYDLRNQLLRYVNAGHNPPVMAMNDEVFPLDKGCTILGVFETLPEVEVGEVQINNEALILTYTDGLSDVRNEEGEFMDEELGYQFVRQHYGLSANDFNDELVKEIDRFRGTEGYSDDLTILTCKIY